MKFLAVLFLAVAVQARQIYEPEPPQPGYGKQNCKPYFDTVFVDHCESYSEKSCHTQHVESCVDQKDENCRAVVSSKQVRKCFDVEEQLCALKEDVEFETIQVPFTVQKCQKVTERVCDTVYETDSNLQTSSSCITVEKPVCHDVDQVLEDRTCRTVTEFDCHQSGYGVPAKQGSYGGSGSGSGDSSSGYGSGDSSYGSGDSNSYGDSSSVSGYGQPQPNCKRKVETKCYKTPRTVTIQKCSRRSEKVCENLKVSVPFVQAKQNCHNEERKVCNLEQRTQPKQVKKYVYSKACRAVPRKVCENADQKSLVPSCAPISRKSCSWSPVESCSEEPKKHCIKLAKKIRKERCEPSPSGYPEPGYPAPPPAPQPQYPSSSSQASSQPQDSGY